MQTITTIGLDIAKSVFQVHGVARASGPDAKRGLNSRHDLREFAAVHETGYGRLCCKSRDRAN
jgi:hypothetical protein